MDGKKLIEWGLIAVVAWFVLTWLLGTAQTVAQTFAPQFAQPDYDAPVFYTNGFVFSTGGFPSPVRWGSPTGGGRGYDGRPRGAGGY